jgi:hypothetical protein
MKKVILALLLIAVFALSFVATFYSIAISSEYQSRRVYSTPQGGSPLEQSWESQLVTVGPSPNSSNVPRDTLIWINGARPVKVENVTLTPYVSIANETNNIYLIGGSTSVFDIYPAVLLQSNTTYVIAATIAGTTSSWNFTTSMDPTQLVFTRVLTTSYFSRNAYWISLIPATLATSLAALAASLAIHHYKKDI